MIRQVGWSGKKFTISISFFHLRGAHALPKWDTSAAAAAALSSRKPAGWWDQSRAMPLRRPLAFGWSLVGDGS